MTLYQCPYVGGVAELPEEREAHIAERHPDLLPEYRYALASTLEDPDTVRRDRHYADALLFTRWFDQIRSGKHVVVVVARDPSSSARCWVVTACIARRLGGGATVEWKRA